MSLVLKQFYAFVIIACFSVSACAAKPSPGDRLLGRAPELSDQAFITADNTVLPLRIWNSALRPPRAIIIGLHGFNDYSNAYSELAPFLADEHGIYTYAYDQRGFGDAGQRGSWAGVNTYVKDLRAVTKAVKQRHPEIPIYVMGESMGGAIALTAFASKNPPQADGVILSAPAVWARRTMPWYQRIALFVAEHTFPKAKFTGKGIKRVASDNREMLIGLGRDPKVIKNTSVDAMAGLSDLMDAALNSADKLKTPALIMIGERDEIVPNSASAAMLRKLANPEAYQQRVAIYENGYHMLFRDLSRQVVWQDIVSWIDDRERSLPSGSDQHHITRWVQAKL